MKIRLRFLVIFVMLVIFFTDQAFWEYYTPNEDDPLLYRLNYVLVAISIGICFLYYRRLPGLLRWWLGLTLAYLGLLMLEGYELRGQWFLYPHVFMKVLSLLMPPGIYLIHRRFGMPPMRALATIMLLVLVGNLLIYHPESLSLSAFADNERGFRAPSAHLFLLLVLLSLNWYLQRPSFISMGVFFLGMTMVFFLQHRTVWVCAALALPVNLLLMRRVPTAVVSWRRISLLVTIPLLFITLGGLATILDNPAVVRRIDESIEDLRNPNKQGTGEWRRLQREAYTPLIEERPLMGWRLEGFEVPVQFYDPNSDRPVWEDYTGHHFHSFYVDRMFYFGFVGVLLALAIPALYVYRRLKQPVPLTPEMAAITSFSITFLAYAYSYDWSFYHYAFIGFMLAALAEPVAIATPVAAPLLPLPESATWPPTPLPAHLPAHLAART
jgi:hypothetical protein